MLQAFFYCVFMVSGFLKYFKTAKSFIIAALIVVLIRVFIFSPFHIPSGSMRNTLVEGDYLIASTYSYGYSNYSFPFGLKILTDRIFYSQPQRGDIVIFRAPHDISTNYIKRCIGLPGDKVQIKNGVVFINDTELVREKTGQHQDVDLNGNDVIVEHYIEYLPEGKSYNVLNHKRQYSAKENSLIYRVPRDHFFFLGDNRDSSSDSRIIREMGFVPKENIVAKARIVLFSILGRMDRFLISLND